MRSRPRAFQSWASVIRGQAKEPPSDQPARLDTAPRIADLLPEQKTAALTAIKQQMLASGKGVRHNARTTIADKTFVYDLTVEPLHDAAGAVVGITCASLDVTGQQGGERTDAGAYRTLPSVKDGDNP